jgi:hypothetical protein
VAENNEYQRALANSVMNIGLVKKDLGQFDQAAEQLHAAQMSADLIDALRVKAELGRVYTGDEDNPGANPVVVLSYALWQRRLASTRRSCLPRHRSSNASMCSRPSCRTRECAVPRSCGVRLEPLARTMITCFAALVLYGSSAIGSGAVSRSPGSADGAPRKRYAAIAFDYFVLFNPDSVVSAVDRVFPGKGRAFTDIWRTRQFEYSWLRSVAGRYVDFSLLTEDALVYAANAVHVELTASQKRQLMDAYLHLTPWPDTLDALGRLRESDVRVIPFDAPAEPGKCMVNGKPSDKRVLFARAY